MTKQQTPIAKAIQKIREECKQDHSVQYVNGLARTIQILESLKEEERKCIEQSYEDGFPPIGADDSQEYFNEKYTQE